MASEIKVDTIVNAGGDNDSGIDLSTNDLVKVNIAGSEKARVDSSGNLLVGKTSADSATGGVQLLPNGISAFGRDGGETLRLNRNTSDGEILRFQKAGTTVGSIGIESSGFYLDGEGSHAGLKMFADSIGPRQNGSDVDDTIDLGFSGGRFDDIFATNGTIQTSDKNEKQDIASITSKELNVAKKLSALFKTFRWKSKVAEKGDKARTHTGIIAQEIQSAFSAEGLDASNYGLFTSDTWTNEEGKEQTRLGVRYPELFSFIFSSIEARLTALESK